VLLFVPAAHALLHLAVLSQPWQFEKYVAAAWQRGYQVREEVVGEFTEAAAAVYAARNTHGVPHDKILMMLDQWRQQ
jgi:hypothetical protein